MDEHIGTGKPNRAKSREERLAAKLRENLRRRKAQVQNSPSKSLESRSQLSEEGTAALPKKVPDG